MKPLCWISLHVVKLTIFLEQQLSSKYIAPGPNFPSSYPLNDYNTRKVQTTLKPLRKIEAILYVKKVSLACPWANVEWYGFIQVSLFFSNLVFFSYFEELRCISKPITWRINYAFIPPHVSQQFIEEENGAKKLKF